MRLAVIAPTAKLYVNDASVLLIFGNVNVLLDKVSVVARPTIVSVLVGSVKVPVLTIVPITGLVSVLLVNVSVPSNVASVPVVGTLTLVAPLTLSVIALPTVVKLLAKVKLPPSLIVLAALTISRVSVRPAVSAVELLAAKVTS